MACKTDDSTERLSKRLEESEDELDIWHAAWVGSLEELSEIEDAFEVDKRNKLHGKTILDIGTDCVKPLYIALKFEPDKIVGINENLYSFASDLEQKSKLLTNTEIKLYNCSLFDDEKLRKILGENRIENRFDFVLMSKTLHHLRTGDCIIYAFEINETFKFEDPVDPFKIISDFRPPQSFSYLDGSIIFQTLRARAFF